MPGDNAAAVIAGERGGAFDAGYGGHDGVRRATKFLRTARQCRTQGQSTFQQGKSSYTSVHR